MFLKCGFRFVMRWLSYPASVELEHCLADALALSIRSYRRLDVGGGRLLLRLVFNTVHFETRLLRDGNRNRNRLGWVSVNYSCHSRKFSNATRVSSELRPHELLVWCIFFYPRVLRKPHLPGPSIGIGMEMIPYAFFSDIWLKNPPSVVP